MEKITRMVINDDSERKTVNAFIDSCPCGSGRLIIDCCVTSRLNTTPPPPKTGYSNPKCYARQLNDCDHKATAEHYVSESVLKIVEVSGRHMKIAGPHWLARGEERPVSLRRLGPKVLCKRHNEALGTLDQIGKKFFEFIMGANVQNEYLMINGDEVERWMLKVLCGYLASGWISRDHKHSEPSNQWLQILFGSDTVPAGSGLYILRGKDITVNYHQIGVRVIESNEAGVFNGLYFLIAGFQFLFFMGSPRPDIPLRIFDSGWQMRYRPECIVIASDSDQREVHLGIPPRGGFVVMKTTPHQR